MTEPKTGNLVPAIWLKDLTFSYRPGQVVVQIRELTIGRGERVFLHGPSGSGKTTLLGVITGILPAQTGTLQILGQDFRTLSGRRRDAFRGANLGYVFQMFNLIPYLNVRDNILLPCRLSAERLARLGDAAPEAAAAALAERLGISHLLSAAVTELSVGQQQRVAAARALIGAPQLVIADEPTSALDTQHREEFLQLLFAEVKRTEASLLFVSHDHSLRGLFDRVVALAEVNTAGAGATTLPIVAAPSTAGRSPSARSPTDV